MNNVPFLIIGGVILVLAILLLGALVLQWAFNGPLGIGAWLGLGFLQYWTAFRVVVICAMFLGVGRK